MERRLKLHECLSSIPGVMEVYYQPPEKIKMEYPCIVYELDSVGSTFADNTPYIQNPRYKVTVIDYDPDSPISVSISKLPMSSFVKHYNADNLNHFVYNLY